MENNKYIIMIQEFGGIDGLSMIYDLDLYEELKGVRSHVVEERDELIPLGFDELALSKELPDIADHIKDGDGLILYNIGNLVDEENTVDPLFIGSHPNQSIQTQGRDAKNMTDISGYLGRGVDKLYSGIASGLILPSISTGGGNEIFVGENRPMNLGLERSGVRFDRINSQDFIGINRTGEIYNRSENFKYDLYEKSWTKEMETIEIIEEITVPVGDMNFPLNDSLKAVIQILENAGNYELSKGAVIGATLGAPNGWDMHRVTYENMHGDDENKGNLQAINDSLHNFIKELKIRGFWDKVTIMLHSEFGRTTHNNSNEGTDHAWGNFTFVFGGDVDGNKMIGDKLLWMGPQFRGTNSLVPTISYDQCFASMFRWLGLSMGDTIDCLLSPEGSFGKTLPIYGYSEDLASEGGSDLDYAIYGMDEELQDGDTIKFKEVTLTLESGTDVKKYILNGEEISMDGELTKDLELEEGINIINVKDDDGKEGVEMTLTVDTTTPPRYEIYGNGNQLVNGEIIEYSNVVLKLFENNLEYKLNENEWVETNEDKSIELELIIGINTIKVKDEYGNRADDFELTVEEEELETPNLDYEIYGVDEELHDGDVIKFKEVSLILNEGTDAIKYILNGTVGNINGELTKYLELKAGENVINVKDEDGNRGIKMKLTVDTTPPEYEIYGNGSQLANEETIDYTDVILNIFENNLEYKLNDGGWINTNEDKSIELGLIIGINTIKVRDEYENRADDFKLTVEEEEPEIPNLGYDIYGEDGVLQAGETIKFKEVSLILNEGTDAIKYILNGTVGNINGELTKYLELKEGKNVINVKDEDGNRGIKMNLTVDTTPPEYEIYGNGSQLANEETIEYSDVTLNIFENNLEYKLNDGGWINTNEDRSIELELIIGINTIKVKDEYGNRADDFSLTVEEEGAEIPEDIEKIADKAAAVWSGEPDTNMFDKTNLYIWGSTGLNSNRVSYLEFDISNIENNGYNQIKLALYIKGKVGVELNFYGSETYNNWGEKTITWNNSDHHDEQYSQIIESDDVTHILDHEFSGNMAVNSYVEFDVTDYLKDVSSDKVTFIITNNRLDGEQGVHFKPTRDIGYQPKLRFKNI